MNIKDWAYERVEQEFKPLAVGKYRLRIKNAEKAVSNNSGNDMLIITFEVSGSNQTLIHYIPFLSDRPQITNRMLTAFLKVFSSSAKVKKQKMTVQRTELKMLLSLSSLLQLLKMRSELTQPIFISNRLKHTQEFVFVLTATLLSL